ncbi:MAG: ribosomal-processing cysteine protease Prp [Alkalispirochaeta sp.]|jgi:uncharacterized protein YsxB (DUF464 family)
MINIRIVHKAGHLLRVQSTGHAVRAGNAVTGNSDSAPCAAVSVLLKSFGLALVEHAGCTVTGDVPREGAFDVTCRHCDDPDWYRGVAELFERSLKEIQMAWPDEVTVHYKEE